MPIRYSTHAKHKLRLLKEFGVNESLVEEAVENPDEMYYDNLAASKVALKKTRQDTGIVVVFKELAVTS